MNDLTLPLAHEDLIDRLCSGESMYAIVTTEKISSGKLRRILEADPDFARAIEHAREYGWNMLADKALWIAENEDNPHRARVIIDTIKWLLSKRSRKTYGDKLEVEIEHKFSLGDALAAAQARVLIVRPVRDQQLTYDTQPIEDAVIISSAAPDIESGDADPFA